MRIFKSTEKHRAEARRYYYQNKQKVLENHRRKYDPIKQSILYKKKKDKPCQDCGIFIDRRSTKCNSCWAKIKKVTMVGRKYPGQTRSIEWRKKMSVAMSGENHPNWKGGRTPINKLRLSKKTWRIRKIECHKRDGYRCQICGLFKEKLEAHHIIPWRITHNDDLNNLLTLCHKCHKKVEARYNLENPI